MNLLLSLIWVFFVCARKLISIDYDTAQTFIRMNNTL